MKNWRETLVLPSAQICQVIQTIDATATQIALVVDENTCLLGTVTDGDVRRGILKGISIDEPVRRIMESKPIVAHERESREDILARMKKYQIHQVPLVDESNRVIGVEIVDELISAKPRNNWVVLMAGGVGSRLRPLTDECPKPLLTVGAKPILETIVEQFIAQGFQRFFLSVNYRDDMVRAHFDDGSQWDADIRYLRESAKLGTAGSLSLLSDRPTHPLIVMNADVLTKINFQQLLDFHSAHQSEATMCVREVDFQVPYGVVKIKKGGICSIDEKPTQRFFVNAGIYVLEPEVLGYVPKRQHFDMPQLFEKLIRKKCRTVAFPVREYWVDIGRKEDFERANSEFFEMSANMQFV